MSQKKVGILVSEVAVARIRRSSCPLCGGSFSVFGRLRIAFCESCGARLEWCLGEGSLTWDLGGSLLE